MEQGKVKTYDSIQRLLNETIQLKQAISPAERLKLFPRRNSSMRVPQPKLSSVTLTLQEETEDDIQDTRLWEPVNQTLQRLRLHKLLLLRTVQNILILHTHSEVFFFIMCADDLEYNCGTKHEHCFRYAINII